MVTWSGGILEDAHTDVFEIRVTVYGETGTQVHFPVVQTCANSEHAWIQVPAEGQDGHDLDSPAPGLTIGQPTDGSSHGDDVEAVDNVAPEDGTDPLTIVALVIGALGLLAGVAALASSRSRTGG